MTDHRTVQASRDAMAHEDEEPGNFDPTAMSGGERLIVMALMLGSIAIVIRGLIAFAHDVGLVG